MDIRVLPSNIANMIAAGEVVQRPASVVKELLENAVDAGADRISLVVTDAGRTLVQVIDNGCGMDPDQAVLCFERHATSKIASAEDLQHIESYGFRGEALPSVAAVAEVTLKTRTADSETATQVTITDATSDNPGKQDVCECAAPVGSNFAVRNLYYNTPARRKFLKSDAAEMKQITGEFIRVAIPNSHIALSLTSNSREIYSLPPASTLKYRLRDIFGEDAVNGLLPVNAETTVVSIEGFVSRPEASRKTVFNQYFFVNGRYFRSPYLNKAVTKAFENILPEGMSPSYFLFLKVDPSSVDVNVHPTKTEIKFEDDNLLFGILSAAVREALGRNTVDALDFDSASLPHLRQIGESFAEYNPVTEPPIPGSEYNPFDGDGFPNQGGWDGKSGDTVWNGGSGEAIWDGKSGDTVRNGGSRGAAQGRPSPYGREGLDGQRLDVLFEDRKQDDARPPVLVKGRYLVTTSQSGFMLVDAQRADERILYESFLEALQEQMPAGQMTLFPLEVDVGAENMPLLEASLPLLQRLGFDYSPFSANTIAVKAVPAGLTDDRLSLSALFYEVISALNEEQASLAASIYAPLAGKMASSAARSATLPSDPAQARKLLDRLYLCENPEFTPDGRRIVKVLTLPEIEKLIQ